MWSLDIEHASPQANGFNREAVLRRPGEWDSKDTRRIWKLREPAYGLFGAPVAFRRSLRENMVNSADPLSNVGLKLEVVSSDLFLDYVFQKSGARAEGAIATHTDGNMGCGEPGMLLNGGVFRNIV